MTSPLGSIRIAPAAIRAPPTDEELAIQASTKTVIHIYTVYHICTVTGDALRISVHSVYFDQGVSLFGV